jgi:hypothetical protein
MKRSMRTLCGLLLATVLLAGCKKDPQPDAVIGGPVAVKPDPVVVTTPETSNDPEENCVSVWLRGKGLDEYGSPQGTVYAGGSPLFDETTGKSRTRLDVVYEKHPAAKESCAPIKKPQP